MSERESRKDGRREWGRKGGGWAGEEEKTDSCREFFLPSSGEISLLSFFLSMPLRLHVVRSVHNKKRKTFSTFIYATKFAYTIKLKIAVCLKLSTVKWISSLRFILFIVAFLFSCFIFFPLIVGKLCRDFSVVSVHHSVSRWNVIEQIVRQFRHRDRHQNRLIYELTLMLS